MNIAIIGAGYVGLVTGAGFAEIGHNVICVDKKENKINMLKKGFIPFYEPGLKNLIKKNIQNNRLRFSLDIKISLNNISICFICVETPRNIDGSADISNIVSVSEEIGEYVNNNLIVVNKSTSPVGTSNLINNIISDKLGSRNVFHKIDVISNPEFLSEGNALHDFFFPSRIILGISHKNGNTDFLIDKMRKLYGKKICGNRKLLVMDTNSAEMTKYASNAMLAMRISFINEIAKLCEVTGANVDNVRLGMGSDPRIGTQYLSPGCGYGGSCLSKDVQALIYMGLKSGYLSKILQDIEDVNARQKEIIPDRICNIFGNNLNGYKFAVWGLSFKPKTNDMRDAPSIKIIEILTNKGASINTYDPYAMMEAHNYYFYMNDQISYFDNKYDALNDCDALIIITEWDEFRTPNFEEMKKRLKRNIIFDGRNIYSREQLTSMGYIYQSIGS